MRREEVEADERESEGIQEEEDGQDHTRRTLSTPTTTGAKKRPLEYSKTVARPRLPAIDHLPGRRIGSWTT